MQKTTMPQEGITFDVSEENLALLRALKHVERPLQHGGLVLILNTGALITPEAEAMLQALHSRSTSGAKGHLEVLGKRGPKKFMETFYVGYGHKSIGDCGTTTIFIEGVSMLVAKAIQDFRLYNGQESSTRYIDFSKQRFALPPALANDHKATAIQERWRNFYVTHMDALVQALSNRYPRNEGEKEETYEKAIRARAFDAMRGFLPAGATTNLAWHVELRLLRDRLDLLRHHPLAEVRHVAEAIEDAALAAFPSSFTTKRYEATEEYNRFIMSQHYLYDPVHDVADFRVSSVNYNRDLLAQYRLAMERRPRFAELPKHMDECGTIQFEFLLDFGSFRDIHRQRSIVQRMPVVSPNHGFHDWYLEELSTDELRQHAHSLLADQEMAMATLGAHKLDEQYITAMGYRLPNRVTGGLPGLVYSVELRAASTVHPTLRKRAIQMGEALEREFGAFGLTLHLDRNPSRFDVKRGTHDIVRVN